MPGRRLGGGRDLIGGGREMMGVIDWENGRLHIKVIQID